METEPYLMAGLGHVALGLWDVQGQKRPPHPHPPVSKSLLSSHFHSNHLTQARGTHQMRRHLPKPE